MSAQGNTPSTEALQEAAVRTEQERLARLQRARDQVEERALKRREDVARLEEKAIVTPDDPEVQKELDIAKKLLSKDEEALATTKKDLDEAVGTLKTLQSKGGESAPKRLKLANDRADDPAGFLNHVLLKKPVDFSKVDVIQLGVHLWGDNKRDTSLINRDFQTGVRTALGFIEKRHSILVVGSKGIGKSCLGLVILQTLLKNHQVVIYEYGRYRMLLVPSDVALERFVTSQPVQEKFQWHSFEMVSEIGFYVFSALEDIEFSHTLSAVPDVVHVVDVGVKGAEVAEGHRQIVISSPNTAKLKRFEETEKEIGDLEYVIYPPWTWEEIRHLNSLRGLNENIVKSKFEMYGGIPRSVLTNETVENAIRYINAMLTKVSLDTWREALLAGSYGEIPEQVPGLFVAITQGTTPSHCKVSFATEYIAMCVIRHFFRAKRAELLTLLNAMDGPKRLMGALQGYLLEELMHEQLLSEKPKTFTVLELQARGPPKNSRSVQFPKLTERKFTRLDMSDIAERMEKRVYYRPTFPNFKSVESFVIVEKEILLKGKRGLCIVAFQATVAERHDLNLSGLQAIQEKVKMGFGEQLDLYVVFVTNAGKSISVRQKLGNGEQAPDETYLQFVLNGMELDSVMLKISDSEVV